MDWYGVGSIFRPIIEFGGIKVALAFLFCVLILVGIGWLIKRIVEAAIDFLRALIAELEKSRDQINVFLTNHLSHLKQEDEANRNQRDETVKTLCSISRIQQEILDQIKHQRDESSSEFKQASVCHTEMQQTLSKIEGNLHI